MSPEDRALVAEAPPFVNASASVMETILRSSVLREYARGDCVFRRGERAEYFFVVLDGWVKMVREGRNGHSVVIAVCAKGETFAEAAALAKSDYAASAEAVSDTRLLAVPGENLLTAMAGNRQVLAAGLVSLFQHTRNLLRQIEALKGLTVRQRLARFLVELAGRGSGEIELLLPYDKALIAAKLGTSPEHLSREFAALRDVGVTTRRDRAWIKDLRALKAVAEGADVE